MKVLMLIGNINNSGGTERVGSMLANGLSEIGYEIVVISIASIDKPFFSLNKEIKITSLSSLPGNKLYRVPNAIYKIRKMVKKECIDTVIAIDTTGIQFTLPATLGLPVNHICWEHFSFKFSSGHKRNSIIQQIAARYCDSIVTLTETDRQCWLQGTRHKSQITAIANPCPFPVQEHIKKDNTKVVLAVGNLIDLLQK